MPNIQGSYIYRFIVDEVSSGVIPRNASPWVLNEMYAGMQCDSQCVTQSATQVNNQARLIDRINASDLTPNEKAIAIIGINRELQRRGSEYCPPHVASIMTWSSTPEGHSFWERISMAEREVHNQESW